MDFVILGPTSLHADGRTVPLGTAKQRGLLALLLYYAGEPVPVDLIVEQLWAGRTVDECREYLYSFASRIRAALNGVGVHNALTRLTGGRAYRLDVDPALIDFYRFRRMVMDAREAGGRGDHQQAAALLVTAIGLWRGEPLSDLRGAHADHLRRYMQEALLSAYKLLSESQLHIGDHYAAILVLEPLIQANELDETLAQLWVMALCAAGRGSDARTFLVTFRRRFRKEVRAEPMVSLPDDVVGARSQRKTLAAVPAGSDEPRQFDADRPRPLQLPGDIRDFTDHEASLTDLDILLDPRRPGTKAVAISGMPGVGKTTLAVHWAHRRRHWFPDGQLFLNASGHGPTPPVEPREALSRFVTALGGTVGRVPATPEELRDRLNQILGQRRVLIVLDNVADSEQVRHMLPTSDTCATLITSRNRLRGLSIREGVRSMTVAPLSDGEALTLLSRLIGEGRTAAESEAVGALSRLSGGLPLALRVVGVHVADRPRASIGELVDELSQHILDADGEDDEEVTLRTMFAWSYRALDADTAAAFRMLSLHPGASIGVQAAAALLDTDPAPAERLLNRLARAHLISHDTAQRYRFHDLIRLYAADRAAHEDALELRMEAMRRLFDGYLCSAVNAAAILAPEETPVPDLQETKGAQAETFRNATEAMRWCEAERTNLAAVTRWAVEHGFPRYAWQIPGTLYVILDRFGRQEDILELQKIALAAAEADGHRQGQIGTLSNLGATYYAMHDYARAVDHWQPCLHLAQEIGYRDAEVACLHNLASAQLKLGDIQTGIQLLGAVIDDCRSTGDLPAEASALHRLGEAYRQLTEYERAAELLLEALAIRERIGLLRGQAATHGDLAALYAEMGRAELAFRHCHNALGIHRWIKDDWARCDTLTTMADVQCSRGRHADALQAAKEALAISEEIADPPRRARALAVLAYTHAVAGNLPSALRAAAAAAAIVDEFSPLADGEFSQARHWVQAVRAFVQRSA